MEPNEEGVMLRKSLILGGVLGLLLSGQGVSQEVLKSDLFLKNPRNFNLKKIGKLERFVKPYKEHEVLAKFSEFLPTTRNLLMNRGIRVLRVYKGFSKSSSKKIVLLHSEKMTTEELIEYLKKLPFVEEVSPNYRRSLYGVVPNDTLFSNQWNMNNENDTDINAPEAWQLTTGSSDVVVAVVDSGVDYTHPELTPNIWRNTAECDGTPGVDDDGNGYVDDCMGYDFGDNDSNPMDLMTVPHGTHVAGIIGAVGNNGEGVSGVNWNVKIVPVKISKGIGEIYDSAIIEALHYVATLKDKGVNIVAVNASWGGYFYNPILRDAIKELGEKGIIFVAAAGNEQVENDAMSVYPCGYDLNNIICVGAYGKDGNIASFSNYGKGTVDIAAPGVDIWSTVIRELECSDEVLFFDDMENGSDNWIAINGWEITSENPHSGNYSWSDSPGGNYPDEINEVLELNKVFDVSSYDGVCVNFWADVNLEEDYDYLYVEYSENNGSSWTPGFAFTGDTEGYVSFIAPFPSSSSDLRVRFHLESDCCENYDGAYVDDVRITGAQFGEPRYQSWNGTSMATPHVTGAVALVAAMYPDDTMEDRIGRIIGNTKMRKNFDKVVGTGGLDLYKALSEGPGPFIDSVKRFGVLPGMEITISGKNFGSSPAVVFENLGNDTSILNGKILSYTDNSITVRVPRDKNLGRYLAVFNGGKSSRFVKLSAWEEVASLPKRLWASTVTYYNGRIYSFGGIDWEEDKTVSDCYVYDTETGVWDNCTAFPGDPDLLPWGSACPFDGKIYVGAYDSIYVYDVSTGNWTAGPEIPLGLRILGLVKVKDNLYMLSFTGEIYVLSDNETFEPVGNLNEPRLTAGVTVYGDEIYVFGGYNGTAAISSAERCDPETGSCVELPPMPVAVAPAKAVAVGKKILIVGNTFNSKYYWLFPTKRTVALFYYPEENRYEFVPGSIMEPPKGNVGFGLVYAPNKGSVYMVGGGILWVRSYDDVYKLPVVEDFDLGKVKGGVHITMPKDCDESCSYDVSVFEPSDVKTPSGYRVYSDKAINIVARDTDGLSVGVEISFDSPLPENVVPFKVTKDGKFISLANYLSEDRRNLVYNISDNGKFDDNSSSGVIEDPVVLLEKTERSTASNSSSSSVGCSIGQTGGEIDLSFLSVVFAFGLLGLKMRKRKLTN